MKGDRTDAANAPIMLVYPFLSKRNSDIATTTPTKMIFSVEVSCISFDYVSFLHCLNNSSLVQYMKNKTQNRLANNVLRPQ